MRKSKFNLSTNKMSCSKYHSIIIKTYKDTFFFLFFFFLSSQNFYTAFLTLRQDQKDTPPLSSGNKILDFPSVKSKVILKNGCSIISVQTWE